MSKLLSDLEDTEEENAVMEKQVAEIDATARELQERRDNLVLGIKENKEKVEKLSNKKHRLEKFIDEKVSENKAAKKQLERELEEIKSKMNDLSKVRSMQDLESHKNPWLMLMLDSIERKIEAKEKELECPVCLEVPSFPFLLSFLKTVAFFLLF